MDAGVGVGAQAIGAGEERLRLHNRARGAPEVIEKARVSAEELEEAADVRHAENLLHVAIDLQHSASRLREWN